MWPNGAPMPEEAARGEIPERYARVLGVAYSPGAIAAIVSFDGRDHEVPVREGYFLFAPGMFPADEEGQRPIHCGSGRAGLGRDLLRRANRVGVRTEDAAIAEAGPEQLPARFAVVEVLAGVGGHRLSLPMSTRGTRDRRVSHDAFHHAEPWVRFGKRWNRGGMYQRKARPIRVRLQTQLGSQLHSQPRGL
jgi:hypothetical protein